MNIQSLSVVVPNKRCVNRCAFCVSRMRNDEYPNRMDEHAPLYDLHLKDYLKRLAFARDNGCNTLMLTGSSEPQQNRNFLTYFGLFMMLLERPFRNVEMQTTGVLIDRPYLRFLRNHVGVNTISLSVSSLDSLCNAAYNGTPEALRIDIATFCRCVKEYDFNLRLSLNLTDAFDALPAEEVLARCKALGADQATFRVLYRSGTDTEQDRWLAAHGGSPQTLEEIRSHIRRHGRALERLEFGAMRYSVQGMSVVVDEDCMATQVKEPLKYLILRPDCKLYSHWDDPASLVF